MFWCIFNPVTHAESKRIDPVGNGSVSTLAVGTPLTSDPGYRHEIHTAHDTIDVEEYGGGFDLTRRATAPKLRVGRDRWFNLLWLIPIGFGLLIASVAIGKGLHNVPAIQSFIARYPGPTRTAAPPPACPRGSVGRTSSTCS